MSGISSLELVAVSENDSVALRSGTESRARGATKPAVVPFPPPVLVLPEMATLQAPPQGPEGALGIRGGTPVW